MPAETRKLPASYVCTGADHWTARSGYQRTTRVPGPIQREAGPAWHWMGFYVGMTAAVVAYAGGWLP